MTLLSENYELFYYYIVLCLFIYNNSIRLINNTDPAKYPKRNQNIMFEETELYHDKMRNKKDYTHFIEYFNKILNQTMNLYSKVWRTLDKTHSKK